MNENRQWPVVAGVVIGGNKIGRRIGFPTANVAVAQDLPIDDGVYAARVEVDGEQYGAMVNLGRKPTVSGSGQRVLEANIFDFDRDIYDHHIEVTLTRFIRPERRFDSFDELRDQIEKDKQEILNLQ